MFRYITFVWDSADAVQKDAAAQLLTRLRSQPQQWRCAFERPGVHVYCTGERSNSAAARTLVGGRGVILGTLFRRSLDRSGLAKYDKASLDLPASERIIASGGRELTSSYWGNYVAILHNAGGNVTWLLRGPASSLPCLRTTYRQVQVCFSSMEDCRDLNFRHFSIDWEYIAVHLISRVSTEHTGLQEVSEVPPGQCIEIGHGSISKHVYWDALEVASTDVIEDPREAVDELRRTVKICVHTWAACHESILHHLSGGLDSSIVLTCLKDAPTHPKITCVTEHSPGPDSDEREYARLAMRTAPRCTHVEQRRNSHIRLEGILGAAMSASPQSCFRRVELAEWQRQLASHERATAIFYGIGGDQLFFQHGLLSVSDFIRRRWFGRELLKIVYDTAQAELLSIWRVLGRAFYLDLLHRRYDLLADVFPYRPLVSAKVIDMVKTQRTAGASWCQSARHATLGKLRHAYALSLMPDYYNPLGRQGDPEEVAPLLSQPLIEVALRIPTYVLMADGWDRGLARRAFETDLPPEIVRRRSKGGMAEHAYEILLRNLPFCRALLLDGLLVQHGLLDRPKLVDALADRPSGVMKGMSEIGGIISIEAWLRLWIGGRETMAIQYSGSP